MNIIEIKAEVSAKVGKALNTLEMRRQFTETKSPTGEIISRVEEPWLAHWDDATRTRVIMHEDIFKQLMSDRNMTGLAYKFVVVPAHANVAAYNRVVVITPKDIEGSL